MSKKLGRPTDYMPEFCNIVIELGKQNKNKTQIAAELGINLDTISEWEKKHEDFSGAMKMSQIYAESAAVAEVMPHVIEETGGPKVNTALFKVLMQNRFGWSSKNEQTISIQESQAEKLSTEELVALYKDKTDKK